MGYSIYRVDNKAWSTIFDQSAYTKRHMILLFNYVISILADPHSLSLQGSGWKVVASFEGSFPNRIKQLPLDRHFDINNVKRVYISNLSFFSYSYLIVYIFCMNCLKYLCVWSIKIVHWYGVRLC